MPCQIGSNIILSPSGYYEKYLRGCRPPVILELISSSPPQDIKNHVTWGCTFAVIIGAISSFTFFHIMNNNIENTILFPLDIMNNTTGRCTHPVIWGVILSSHHLDVTNIYHGGCAHRVIWGVISSSPPLEITKNIEAECTPPMIWRVISFSALLDIRSNITGVRPAI